MSCLKDIDPLGIHACMILGQEIFFPLNLGYLLMIYMRVIISLMYDQGGYGSFDKYDAFSNSD